MRALPVGFPKLMVSTMASGHTAPYVASKDIVMFPSIVDVSGINASPAPLPPGRRGDRRNGRCG